MLDYRDEIVKKLRWSLNGSNHLDSKEDKDEYFNLLYSEPGSKYITGILSPSLNTNEDESSLDDSPFSKTGASDSSFGFTFALPKELADNFIFGADFSTYKSIQVDGKERFKRIPFSKEFSVNQATLSAKNKIEHQLIVLKSKNGDAEIKLILTKRIDIQDVDRIIYTLSIVHFGKEESGMRKWRDTLFQVRVWVRYSNGFVELPYKSLDLTENSQQSSLLYRNLHRYSIGHGCGTNYQGDIPIEIESTFFPNVEVPVYKHKSIDSDSLSMLHWAEGNTDFELLNTIPSDYGDWLNEQMNKMNELSSSQILTLNQNKINVELAKSRIEEGIKLIQNSKELQQAFKWMNLAMLTQQIRTKLPTVAVEEKNGVFTEGDSLEFDVFDKNTWPVDKNIYGKWRLFQMAFILMCISDIDAPSENQSMDLIWFPTGGGKTEAYLGLSAFTLLVERLKGADSFIGVKIIMRYTLRLLTAQQFERAAAMIVALDDIRKENTSLGTHPISIGLWVGGSVTFNSHGQPVTGYNKNPNTSNQWYANTNFDYANRPWPWILQKCPRCNREFGVFGSAQKNNVKIFGVHQNSSSKVHFLCKCESSQSKPSNNLPIYVVDDDLYSELPSLIIGTVDKFARLTWKPESSKLLGVNSVGRGNHSQVKMIIQDELHLLEGPLGTIVGLYECAIDYLMKKTGAFPKRIGSSATLAMAKEQCRSIYGLKLNQVNIFPPSLLDWDDNYFSFVDKSAKGRRYTGIYANGSPSVKTTQYRLYASLLQTGEDLYHEYKESADGYTTLVNYFNSTRNMGQALSLMGDDVPREVRRLSKEFKSESSAWDVDINQGLVQLHGNVSSDKVQKDMQRLLVKKMEKKHVHTVLATNMISVGLDVPRLSLMAITHQPKSMSEYIQASSRVGRGRTPGIVFTILSSLRSRDRSHLEDFKATHEKMYSLVEPSSLTPFSTTALDRALPGVLIAIFRNDPQKGMFEEFKQIDDDLITSVKSFFMERVKVVDEFETASFEDKFDNICKKWNLAGFHAFGKEIHNNTSDNPLMVPFLTPWKGDVQPFQVLQAMRNVDSGIELKKIPNPYAK